MGVAQSSEKLPPSEEKLHVHSEGYSLVFLETLKARKNEQQRKLVFCVTWSRQVLFLKREREQGQNKERCVVSEGSKAACGCLKSLRKNAKQLARVDGGVEASKLKQSLKF